MPNSKAEGVPLKVALVTQGYFTGGGVPTVAKWLERGLRTSSRFEVQVFDLATSGSGAGSRQLLRPRTWLRRSLRGPTREGVEVWGANASEIEVMRYYPRRELSRTLRAYDVVQVVGGSPALARAFTGMGRPVVIQVATTVKWERVARQRAWSGPVGWWRRLMTEWTARMEVSALRGADVVMVENHQMFDYSLMKGQMRTQFAPPGINTSEFRPHLEGWDSTRYILSLCRLGDPRKGLERTVHAYSEMVRTGSDVPRLVLAGRGDVQASLRTLIRELDLEKKVEIRRDVLAPELPSLLAGASVFLQTSFEEGLGLSVVEAMASGLPVVATLTAGSEETVAHGETGWLVSQATEASIADEVARLAMSLLHENGAAFGAAGRARAVKHFDSRTNLQEFVSAYDLLTASAPK